MKKLVAMLLVLMMCLSLCACSTKKEPVSVSEPTTVEALEPMPVELSKEEMLVCAVDIGDYAAEMTENKLRAEEKYINNVFYVTGIVSNIQSDSVDVGDFTVSLPTEEIMELSSGQKITIVGKIDSLTMEESQVMADGWSFDETTIHGVMTNAYFVNDIYELSGTLIFYYMKLMDINGVNHNRDGQEEAWSFGLDMVDDNVIAVAYSMKEDIPVNHVEGVAIDTVTISGTELHYEDKITVSARIINNNLYDVELISVN